MTKLWRHILFWSFIYIVWTYMKSGGTFWRPVFFINIVNIGIYMSAYYLLKNHQLPHLYNQRKWGRFILSLLASSLVFYAIWRIAGIWWIDAIYFPNRTVPLATMVGYLTQTVQFYSPAIALLAIETYHDRQQEKVRIEQLEKEKIANELKFLKAQINPHFLFNTLNNLYSYIVNQSPKAPDIILQLSAMLDYILYRSQKTTVSLREEVECIENFLKLEQIRYGERLKVDYKIEGDMMIPISPLLLLSVVENAFKHGASGDIDSPEIEIKIRAEEDSINCEVWNTKSQHQGELNDAYKKGIGLSNIKRQLKLTYPNQHQFKIEDKKSSFYVSVIINPKLEETPNP